MRYSDGEGGGPRDRDEPVDDQFKEASGVTITGAHQAVSRPADPDAPVEASLDDWSFVRGTSPDPELPHWTEAPTGQVPAVLAREDADAQSDDPWSAVPAPAWREDETDWSAHEEAFEPAMLSEDAVLAEEPKRPWELDETQVTSSLDDEDLALAGAVGAAASTTSTQPATRVRARNARSRRGAGSGGEGTMAGRAARPETPASRNMGVAIATGAVLGIAALIIFNSAAWVALLLAIVVVTMGAGEAFGALRHAGHRPAAALGLVACLTLMIASYNKGVVALPLVTALAFFFSFLWYLGGVERSDAIDGMGTTMLVFVWVGVLGSFAGLLLAPSDFPGKDGMHLLLGAIILTVGNDVGALAGGRMFGRRPMAASISPNKTWEGVLGGALVTLLLAFVVALFISPWDKHAAAAFTLAFFVMVFAPLGDLCESMFKRSIGVKDMGRMLPGHGGVLDRLDGLLFVLPVTYYVAQAFHLS